MMYIYVKHFVGGDFDVDVNISLLGSTPLVGVDRLVENVIKKISRTPLAGVRPCCPGQWIFYMSQKTYTQIHIHVVFAVQNRERVLDEKWRDRLYKYIIAIMQKHGHKVLAIGGVDDHVHILFGHRSDHALPSLMAEIKRDSSKWINQNNLVIGKFIWQEGYAAFSYSKSDIGKVVKYIANQEKHHAGESSFEEYKNILKRSGMEFDERYLA